MNHALQKLRSKSRGWKRSKNGCLTCRKRRKRCDETKPICTGCERNHLLCHWQRLLYAPHATEKEHQTPEEQSGPKNPQIMLGNTSIEVTASSSLDIHILGYVHALPAVLRGNHYLFQHYIHFTANRMAAKRIPDNPFLSLNCQIALDNDLMEHSIIAISSSHLLFSDLTQASVSRMHYAVVLRGIKHRITKWKYLATKDKISLLAVVLATCWFEVIDVNTDGALYHHLRASRIMITDLQKHSMTRNKLVLGFLAEQYAYLALVSNIVFSPKQMNRQLDRRLPYTSVRAINEGTQIYGCLFGCSHQLYESIILICDFATLRRLEGQQPSATSYIHLYSLQSHILDWRPEGNLHDGETEIAGYIYQESCMIFLQTSFHGPHAPTDVLYERVDPLVVRFLENFMKLSYEAASWTTISWPCLVAGSCMRVHAQREKLSRIIFHSTIRMRAIQQIISTLSLLWAEMDRDITTYGPYGLEKVLEQNKISLCIG